MFSVRNGISILQYLQNDNKRKYVLTLLFYWLVCNINEARVYFSIYNFNAMSVTYRVLRRRMDYDFAFKE